LSGIRVTWWKAIRNGLESKRWQTIEAMGASRLKETLMVVFSVDKGDMKAFMIEDFGQF